MVQQFNLITHGKPIPAAEGQETQVRPFGTNNLTFDEPLAAKDAAPAADTGHSAQSPNRERQTDNRFDGANTS